MNKAVLLSIFAIVCVTIAELWPIPEGEYTTAQVEAMNHLVETATAEDWLSQLERNNNAH